MSHTKHVTGTILAVFMIVLGLTGCASLRGQADKNYIDVETIRLRVADDAKPAATAVTPIETWEWTPKTGDTLSGLHQGSGYDRVFGDIQRFAKAMNPPPVHPDQILAGVTYRLPAPPPNGKLVVVPPARREAPSTISLVPTASKPTPIKLPVIATSVPNGSEEKARIADQNIQINQLEATNTRLRDELAAEKLTRINEQARLAKAQVGLARAQEEFSRIIKTNEDLEKENEVLKNSPPIWPAVLLAFGIGAVVATLLGIVAWRTRRKNTSFEQQVERLQKEVEEKRTVNLELRQRIEQLEMAAAAGTKEHFFPLSLRGTGLINRSDPKSKVINVWLDPILTKNTGAPMTCCGIDRNTPIGAKKIAEHARKCSDECREVHNVGLEQVTESQPQQATA